MYFPWSCSSKKFLGLTTEYHLDYVLAVLQYQLRRASLTASDAFAILKADSDGDYITYSGFCDALRQVC